MLLLDYIVILRNIVYSSDIFFRSIFRPLVHGKASRLYMKRFHNNGFVVTLPTLFLLPFENCSEIKLKLSKNSRGVIICCAIVNYTRLHDFT